jgi:hypothetical protein
MDENKPIDPRANEGHISMIADEEMQRINIEASYNLSRLLIKMYSDEDKAVDLLQRAYDWLPMPQKQVKTNWETVQNVYGILIERQGYDLGDPYRERSKLAIENPFRSLANIIMKFAYRNRKGPIEAMHSGREWAYSLDKRRFTSRQSGDVIRTTAEQMAGVFAVFPAWSSEIPNLTVEWPQRLQALPYHALYPCNWSLTASSSDVVLMKNCA